MTRKVPSALLMRILLADPLRMSDCAPRLDWDLRAALGRMIGDPLGDGEWLVASLGIP